MVVTWTLGRDSTSGQDHTGMGVLTEAFENGSILPGASATQFHLKSGPNLVTFRGNFVENGGIVQSGTITGFDAYYDNSNNHLIAGTGHAIDFAAFQQALSKYKMNDPLPMFHLLFDAPMTVNGSDYPFQLEVVPGGFAKDTVFGNRGNDHIFNLGGDDVIYGGAGDDHITGDAPELGGNAGDDSIFGGDGADTLDGSVGDDFLSGGAGKDVIDGGPGSDTADFSEKVDALTIVLNGPNPVEAKIAGFVEDTLSNVENIKGGSGNDKFVGDGFRNHLAGNEGDDRLKGKDGDDTLFGGNGRDRLNGGKDEDTLSGGKRHDVLKGGPDKDMFQFDVPKSEHSDVVLDFGGKDKIALAADVFTAVNDSGKLKAKFFTKNDKAQDGNDHVLYLDGALRYDPDGKGGKGAILVAKLKGAPDVDASDIVMA